MVFKRWGQTNLGPTDHNNQDSFSLVVGVINSVNLRKVSVTDRFPEEDFKFDIFGDSSKLDVSMNLDDDFNDNTFAFFSSVHQFVYGGRIYDAFNGTVNGLLWESVGEDTGTTSESASFIQHGFTKAGGTQVDVTLSAKAFDFVPFSGTVNECVLRVNYQYSGGSGTTDGEAFLYIRDESGNQVALHTFVTTDSGSLDSSFVYRLVLIDANTIRVYTDKTTSSDVDVSSLDGGEAWHLRFRNAIYRIGAGTPVSFVRVFPMLFAGGTLVDDRDFITGDTISSGTVNIFLFVFNNESGTVGGTEASFDYFGSADSGTTFTSGTDQQIFDLGSSGINVKYKVIIGGSPSLLPKIFDYGGVHG